jgi:hypothetical protein
MFVYIFMILEAHSHVQREVCVSKIPVDVYERGVWLVLFSLLSADTNRRASGLLMTRSAQLIRMIQFEIMHCVRSWRC